MFSRKNQTILSAHYSKLVERDEPSTSGFDAGDEENDEDFFSLKRADHDLPVDLVDHSDLSKRKVRMMKSKKALAKAGPKGTKLVFDEDGQAHAIYEFKDAKDMNMELDGAEFMKKEIGKMQKADADDKAVAKEKKREKKRKRKEREREEVSFATALTLIPSLVGLNNSIRSQATPRVMLVPLSRLLQMMMATFPQCSICHRSRGTNE